MTNVTRMLVSVKMIQDFLNDLKRTAEAQFEEDFQAVGTPEVEAAEPTLSTDESEELSLRLRQSAKIDVMADEMIVMLNKIRASLELIEPGQDQGEMRLEVSAHA